MRKIAVFASGSGTNAENIIRHFEDSPLARVDLVLSNNPEAGVLARAESLGVDTLVFDRDTLYNSDAVSATLKERGIDYLVLAGFLWLVPAHLIGAFPGRVVNIHPALLPKYGGKGMYGDRVHRAVVEAGEKESGITIHKVNEHYDEGAVLAQFTVPIAPDDTPEQVAEKVHKLEYKHFPTVIESEIRKL